MDFFKTTLLAMAFVALLAGCDLSKEDVVPKSFVEFTLYPDEMYDYHFPDATSQLRLDPLHNDSIKTDVTVAYGQPAHGSIELQQDGFVYYTPTSGYMGADNFTYTVCSASGCKTENIKIIIEAFPDPDNCSLTVNPDAVSTTRNQWVDIRVYKNDVICTPLNMNIETQFPEKGSFEIISYSGSHPNNTVYRYYPPRNYTGQDTFLYRVYNPDGTTYSEARVTITIQ